MWKSRRKFRLLYFILPTQLRGKVQRVHHTLLTFVWAMRRLDGQVHSFEQCKSLGILPGSRSVVKDNLDAVGTDLKFGPVLFNGAMSPGHLKPGVKHFVHYGDYTMSHGLLRILWMATFERCVLCYLFFLSIHTPTHHTDSTNTSSL